MEPFVRSAYNYDMDKASLESGLECLDPSKTQQSFRDEVDINTIVERFHLTGEMPQLQQLPAYEDYEGIFDFQSAMNQIRAASEEFMTLPAKVRARFHNNAQEFLDFCSNMDENRDEARKLGILNEKLNDETGEVTTNARPATQSANPSSPQSGSQAQTPGGGPASTTNPTSTGQGR